MTEYHAPPGETIQFYPHDNAAGYTASWGPAFNDQVSHAAMMNYGQSMTAAYRGAMQAEIQRNQAAAVARGRKHRRRHSVDWWRGFQLGGFLGFIGGVVGVVAGIWWGISV